MDSAPRTPARAEATNIKRFDSATKTQADWDGLRKDSELWLDGDCPVHFYTQGASQRGPSLRIPSSLIRSSGCSYLLEQCASISRPDSPASSAGGHSDSGYAGSDTSDSKLYELYIPAPTDFTREQAFTYHLTTRNYFALLTSKSLVGDTLGNALIALHQRLTSWRHPDPTSSLLTYCSTLSYTAFVNQPSYALASLRLAEHIRNKIFWTETLVHSIGMQDRLDLSPEYPHLNNRTKALIARASSERDSHISRVTKALSGFLEEELGTENLGLSMPARQHLDRFRSFLHGWYVDKLGWYPPTSSRGEYGSGRKPAWQGSIWKSMTTDFQALYDYLVDTTSGSGNGYTTDGGVCVLQNVQAFDARHGNQPLPHRLPLLSVQAAARPVPRSNDRATPSRLRSFRLNRPDTYAPRNLAINAPTGDHAVVNPLIEAYADFESQSLRERLSPVEARKVRWLLIYGCLQMLLSITHPPSPINPETAERAAYPLCVATALPPTWLHEKEDNHDSKRQDPSEDPNTIASNPHHPISTQQQDTQPSGLNNEDEDDHISIHPDCQAENADEYFSLSRRASVFTTSSSGEASAAVSAIVPAPLRVVSQPIVGRKSSLRNYGIGGGMGRRVGGGFLGSLRRGGREGRAGFSEREWVGNVNGDGKGGTQMENVPGNEKGAEWQRSRGEGIVIEGYGDGKAVASSTVSMSQGQDVERGVEERFGGDPVRTRRNDSYASFDFGLGSTSRQTEEDGPPKEEEWSEPTVQDFHLDMGDFAPFFGPASSHNSVNDWDPEIFNPTSVPTTSSPQNSQSDSSPINSSPATTWSLDFDPDTLTPMTEVSRQDSFKYQPSHRRNSNGLSLDLSSSNSSSSNSATSLSSLAEKDTLSNARGGSSHSSPNDLPDSGKRPQQPQRPRGRYNHLNLGLKTSCTSLNSQAVPETYTPTGLAEAAKTRAGASFSITVTGSPTGSMGSATTCTGYGDGEGGEQGVTSGVGAAGTYMPTGFTETAEARAGDSIASTAEDNDYSDSGSAKEVSLRHRRQKVKSARLEREKGNVDSGRG